jgi:hypothetical protein
LLEFTDQVDQLRIRSFGARLALGAGGIQESIFEIPQSTMEPEEGGRAENDGGAEKSARIEHGRGKAQQETISRREPWGAPAVSPQHQELVLEEQVFGEHSPGATCS